MGQVKLILQENVPNLGDAGDLIAVKPGYARNFLVPQGKAIPATDARIRESEHIKRVVAEKIARELKTHTAMRDRIGNLEIEVSAKAGEEGKLFGSVTTPQIVELLAEKGVEIDRRKIELDEPIKTVGEHQVPIRLHRDVIATLKVKVSAAD
jgi:large subunit ribosomal protein L9